MSPTGSARGPEPSRGKGDASGSLGRLVVIGGGTGISAALRGVKNDALDISAIVTVADDGGSSGRLRKDYHMLPPGDIRNCLVALAHGDPLVADLFAYRFEDSILRGHSFGNLALAVLTRLTGDFKTAVEHARRILGVTGRVLPSTDTRVVLVASHPDGTKSTGEQCISRLDAPIIDMELRPRPPAIDNEIRETLAQADLIVLGPGSLFTSIIPNLLVPGMVEAIESAPAKVVLVSNLMTQPGETRGFSPADHFKAINTIGGLRRIDAVVMSTSRISDEVRFRYQAAGAEILGCDPEATHLEGVPVITADLATISANGNLRHDGDRLAAVLRKVLQQVRTQRGEGTIS